MAVSPAGDRISFLVGEIVEAPDSMAKRAMPHIDIAEHLGYRSGYDGRKSIDEAWTDFRINHNYYELHYHGNIEAEKFRSAFVAGQIDARIYDIQMLVKRRKLKGRRKILKLVNQLLKEIIP